MLFLAGFVIAAGSPTLDDDPGKLVSWYSSHHGCEFASAVLVTVVAVFLAGFVSSLREG